MIQIADLAVAPKPRMSQRDRWAKRPCVLRYRASGDELRLNRLRLPETFCAVFFVAMPQSWPADLKRRMVGTEHRQKPDGSNLIKALEDHLTPRDEVHHDGRWIKRWSWSSRLVVIDTSRRTVGSDDLAEWLPGSPR